MLFSPGGLAISDAASPCGKKIKGSKETRRPPTFDPDGTHGHLADGGLLQEELEVADPPGVRGRVRGLDQVRGGGHQLQRTAAFRQTHTLILNVFVFVFLFTS